MALLDESPLRTPARPRVRTLAAAALLPLLLGHAAIAAVFALVTAFAPRASFSVDGVLGAAVPGWLAAYQVPLVISDRALGALPLLPTLLLALLVGWVVAVAARRADARGPQQTGWIAGVVALAHAAAGLTAALLLDGPLRVDPLAGFYYPALISGAACVVALARRSEVLTGLSGRIDPLAVRGLRAGVLACVALVAVGAVVVVIGLVTAFGRVTSLFTGGAGESAGLFLLSLGYLPNAVIAGLGFAAGPGFGIGEVSVAPLGFSGGAVPAVPLLGALPSGPQLWWPALFVLPLAVGLLVGWALRDADESPVARLRAVSVASILVAAVVAVLAGSAGGALGGGPFDPLDLRAAALSLAMVGWIGVPAGVLAWFAGPHPVAAGLIEPEADADEDEPGQPDGTDEPDSPEESDEDDAAVEAADDTADDAADPAADDVASDTDAADEDR
ncbi:DUF6350 family protein [Actinokineospora sp. UTMC 2448]|uniref:cell division protein PerM n=1 Tax=Actinokineospora sp. UTMC 2448 TaxID=2268449 RepID=UPI00216497FC|nr:DUF6350 family protein [Actinokineospora sp. UTMC 2448]UVS82058.1 hypothetical protein Actkin_05823 [Actinokineospora sp. UTMC 2448]